MYRAEVSSVSMACHSRRVCVLSLEAPRTTFTSIAPLEQDHPMRSHYSTQRQLRTCDQTEPGVTLEYTFTGPAGSLPVSLPQPIM